MVRRRCRCRRTSGWRNGAGAAAGSIDVIDGGSWPSVRRVVKRHSRTIGRRSSRFLLFMCVLFLTQAAGWHSAALVSADRACACAIIDMCVCVCVCTRVNTVCPDATRAATRVPPDHGSSDPRTDAFYDKVILYDIKTASAHARKRRHLLTQCLPAHFTRRSPPAASCGGAVRLRHTVSLQRREARGDRRPATCVRLCAAPPICHIK